MSVPAERPWSKRAHAPIRAMSDVEDLGHTARVHLKLASDDRMPLDALLVRGLVEDTLIVSLHGYTDRKKYIPPRFERLASLSTLERHGLYLADPTIRLSPKLSLGWYVGDETYDPTPDLADLINSIARHLEVERVLLTGSSGGGFASMALAPRVENATALVFSPQTRIRRLPSVSRQAVSRDRLPLVLLVARDRGTASRPRRSVLGLCARSRRRRRVRSEHGRRVPHE